MLTFRKSLKPSPLLLGIWTWLATLFTAQQSNTSGPTPRHEHGLGRRKEISPILLNRLCHNKSPQTTQCFFLSVLSLPRHARTSNDDIRHDVQLSRSTCCNRLSSSSLITTFSIFLMFPFSIIFSISLYFVEGIPNIFTTAQRSNKNEEFWNDSVLWCTYPKTERSGKLLVWEFASPRGSYRSTSSMRRFLCGDLVQSAPRATVQRLRLSLSEAVEIKNA